MAGMIAAREFNRDVFIIAASVIVQLLTQVSPAISQLTVAPSPSPAPVTAYVHVVNQADCDPYCKNAAAGSEGVPPPQNCTNDCEVSGCSHGAF